MCVCVCVCVWVCGGGGSVGGWECGEWTVHVWLYIRVLVLLDRNAWPAATSWCRQQSQRQTGRVPPTAVEPPPSRYLRAARYVAVPPVGRAALRRQRWGKSRLFTPPLSKRLGEYLFLQDKIRVRSAVKGMQGMLRSGA